MNRASIDVAKTAWYKRMGDADEKLVQSILNDTACKMGGKV